jgi:hypothetical protein
MAPSSRMQIARRRLRVARYSISAVAVTAFGALGFVVRDAHPATHTGSTAVTASSTATASTADSATTFGGSASISPAPQYAAPQVQSSGS